MRINKFLALASDLSRRGADKAIADGRVLINNIPAQTGQETTDTDVIALDGKVLHIPQFRQTIMLNKPVGFVVSHNGQGSKTIYDLLPKQYQNLNPVGRLDKNSSGLLLLTNDGNLANILTHPSHQKNKIYEVGIDKALSPQDHATITGEGVPLNDGRSKLGLKQLGPNGTIWQITMSEGRNRQIRRTFEALGYKVTRLHRTNFGDYFLSPNLATGKFIEII